jgi:hypothetical protein
MKMKKYIILLSFTASSLLIGCNKNYLDTKPSDAILPEQVYATIASLNSAVTANYLATFDYVPVGGGGAMHDAYGQKSIDLANDLMGEDMVVHAQGFGWYNADYNYTAWTRPNGVNTRSSITWSFYYEIIKQANLMLDAFAGEIPSADKQAVLGEAYALRAWAYLGLINNYQQTYRGNEDKKGVPLYTSSSSAKGRGTVAEVYGQIVNDLTTAENLLNGKTRTSKQRIDVSVVRGLRARVALVMEEWATAAEYANKAINTPQPPPLNKYQLMPNTTYNSRSGFSSISNTEWMWGALIPADQATIFASFFSHIDATQFGYAQLGGQKKITKSLYDRIPTGDIRKSVFRAPGTGTNILPDYTQTKFAVPTVGSWAADYLYMRIAEMYLIEAEALARQGKDEEAKIPLELLCKQRFPAYTATNFSGTDLLNEILLQRKIELWGEGFSLFDIKRNRTGLNRPTGPGNHGLPSLNPVVISLPDASPLFLMRIPQTEIDNNPQMTAADQNP